MTYAIRTFWLYGGGSCLSKHEERLSLVPQPARLLSFGIRWETCPSSAETRG
jgi:hypothetical protein